MVVPKGWNKKPYAAFKGKKSSIFRRTSFTPFASQVPTLRVPRNMMPYNRERENLTNIVRTCVKDQYANVTAPVALAYSFQLSDLPGYTDFTNLYDRYRILKVEITFSCSWDSSDMTAQSVIGSPNMQLPLCVFAEDWDNVTPPTSIGNIMQHSEAKTFRLKGSQRFVVYPRPLNVTNSGLYADAGGSDGKPVWCSTDFAGVEHFGVKLWMNNWQLGTGAVSPQCTMVCRYFLQCSNMK